MNNEHYLIHKDDYIKHIDDKFQLFMMLQGLTNLVSKLPPDEKNIPAIALAMHHRKESEEMFKTWGVPRSYMIFGSEADLAELMENELIAPEDAGYYPIDDEDDCDGECCCGDCDNCSYYDKDDEDECDDDEAIAEFMEGFGSLLTDFNELARSIFGDNVSVHIIVD